MAYLTSTVRGPRRATLRIFAFLLALGAPALHPIVDLDHDGISDIWRTTFPDASAATVNPDGDGASNLAESLAGTSPFDHTSRLVASAPETDAFSNIHLRWTGASGGRYCIALPAR